MANLIKLKAVTAKTTLSKTTIYALMKEGSFPQNIEIGKRGVAWVDTEIQEWIDNKISGRH